MIIYSTLNCPKCNLLKAALQKANIAFLICIDEEMMASKNIRSVPALELDDGTILNFPSALKALKEGTLC